MSANSKAELRKKLLAVRRQVFSQERDKAAEKAANIFQTTSLFQNSRHIACYYPLGDEFDCWPIIRAIWRAKKTCYLPVITEQSCLSFAQYQESAALQPNQFRIPEPVNSDTIDVEALDLVILPLLGFDVQGNRLGMGGGYYDRTFAHLLRPVYLLGLAYERQQVSCLPHDSWDVLLNGVLTEEKITYF